MFKRASLLGALALCACGGGGGGGGGGSAPLTLHFTQTPLSQTFYHWDIPQSPSEPNAVVPVNVTVSGSTTATTFYVFVTDLGSTFEAGEIDFYQTGADSFHADLPVQDSLSLGNHSGTLNVKVCSDPGCGNVLTSKDQAYSVKVQANPTLQVAASGTLVGKALDTGAGDPNVTGFLLPTLTFEGVAQLAEEFHSPIYIKATDSNGRVSVRPWTTGVDWAYLAAIPASETFQLDFATAADLAVGTYDGTLTLQVCRDPVCRYPFSGASTITYQLGVSTANATALAPVVGAPDWQTEYGNPGRTAYVPITVDKNAFAPRWLSKVAQTASHNYGYDVVTGAGNVFVRRQGEYNSASTDLYALAESDGAIDWQDNFTGGTMSPMLGANGNVYLQTAVYGEGAVLRALAAADGAEVFAQTTGSLYASNPPIALGANLIVQDAVDTGMGTGYRFRRYNGATGELLATPSCLATAEAAQSSAPGGGIGVGRSPPTAGDKAYIQMATGLEVVDFGAAQSCTHFNIGDIWHFATAGAVTPGTRFIHTASHCSSDVLRMFDPATFGGWSSEMGNCTANNAAIRNGVVYAMNGSGLQALDEATGTLQWSVELFNAFGVHGGGVLVTDNMAFVIAGRVFAIDLVTHKVVWTLSPLSVLEGAWGLSSSGVLYLVDRQPWPATTWSLVAVNLR